MKLLLPMAAILMTTSGLESFAAESGSTIRVACVGDSITYGKNISGRETNSYPAVLARLLGRGYEVGNFGVSGTTLLKRGDYPYWRTAAFHDATAFNAHIVIIKLGTNDTKGRNWQFGDDFAGDLRDLIAHFRNQPNRPEIRLCVPAPMYGVFRYLNDRTLRREVIPVLERIADEEQVRLIDIYTALDDQSELFPDGVHPNREGAARIAETVYQSFTTP